MAAARDREPRVCVETSIAPILLRAVIVVICVIHRISPCRPRALQTLQTPWPFQRRCSAGASQLKPISDDCRLAFGFACADSHLKEKEFCSHLSHVKKVPLLQACEGDRV